MDDLVIIEKPSLSLVGVGTRTLKREASRQFLFDNKN